MRNILYEPFPDSVRIGDGDVPVLTDFREWLRFSDLIADRDIPADWKIFLFREWFVQPPDAVTAEMVKALFGFYRAAELLPDTAVQEEETPPSPPVLSFRVDGGCILGDFRRYYGMDLLHTAYLHWWEFRSLLAALPDESLCQKRIAYRSADLSKIRDPAEKERVRRIQHRIALPFVYDDYAIGAAFGG